MKNLFIFLITLIILSLELISSNKIQSLEGTQIRFKPYSVGESTTDRNSGLTEFFGKIKYSMSQDISKKLSFIHHYRNFLKKGQIVVEKNGNEIIEKGQIYIKLKNKLNLINEENHKLYDYSFGIAELDKMFLENKGIKINQLFKLKNIDLFLNLSQETDIYREALQRTYLIEFDENIDIIQFCIDLASDPNVEYAEPVPIHQSHAVPNDANYSNQFALPLMQCPEAWDIFKGENSSEEIIIGVCDSGVEWNHPDLVNNLYQNMGEDFNKNGYILFYDGNNWIVDPEDINYTDDDGNGHVDDFFGWNYFTNDGSIPNDPMATNPNRHGTHVAGICNASTNNNRGVAGLPWNIKFLPTKHANNNIGTTIYFGYDGIVYLAENGADVINCSWGGGAWSETEQNAVNYASSLGALIVSSAGNNNEYLLNFPASYQNVLSVASVNSQKRKANYSTYHISVDVSAYGGEITSDGGIFSTVPSSYNYLQGTSMASPYVAALAAYYKSYKPNSSNYDIIKAVLGSSTNVDDYNPGYERTLGHGIINAYNAITTNNPDIDHTPYISLLDVIYYEPSGNGQINNGETIDWEFLIKNYNHLYGTNNFKYFITTSDPDVTVLNGTGTTNLDADGYLSLDNIHFKISQNCPNKIAKFDIKFDINDGYEYNFVSSILILNSTAQTNAYAYIAYDPVNDIMGPCKFNITDPTNITLIQDQSTLPWVRAGTYFNNNWYGFDDNNNLITIDMTTGNRTQIKNFYSDAGGISYDYLSRSLYGIVPNDFFGLLDYSSGSFLDYYQVFNTYINLAADKNGNMYSIDITNDALYRIKRYVENQEYVGHFNYDLNYAQDMELDYNSNILFATLYTLGGESIFVAVDKEYGFVFEIANIQNSYELTGLTIPHNWDFTGIKLNSPIYNESPVLEDDIFSWDNFSGANKYKIEFSLNESFSNIIYQETINNNSFRPQPNKLIKGLRYFWRVFAYNNDVQLSSSPIWTFWMVTPNYCMAYSDECDEYIGNLSFSNIVNNSECNLYSNHIDLVAELRQARNYEIHIYNPESYIGDAVAVFIDWNQNEIFDLPEEKYQLTTTDYQNFSAVISVSENAPLGRTVMRARIVYDTEVDPCGSSDFGEVEDYSILVLEKLDAQVISLSSGWNMISSYIIPLSSRMEDIWEQISQNLLIIKNNLGQAYIPSYGINNIGNWVLTQGYRAYITNASNLTMLGTTCEPENEDVSFSSGWNTIGYIRSLELSAITAFADLVSQDALLIAKNLSGQVYIPSFGINNIGNLLPGQAYQIYCTKSGTFKYPSK